MFMIVQLVNKYQYYSIPSMSHSNNSGTVGYVIRKRGSWNADSMERAVILFNHMKDLPANEKFSLKSIAKHLQCSS